MKNENLARQYVFAIHKLRDLGGLKFNNPKSVKIAKLAESRLIEAGITHESNRGRFLYINEHVQYESDLQRFVLNNF